MNTKQKLDKAIQRELDQAALRAWEVAFWHGLGWKVRRDIVEAINQRTTIEQKDEAKWNTRPQFCGSGHCSCIKCPYPDSDDYI